MSPSIEPELVGSAAEGSSASAVNSFRLSFRLPLWIPSLIALCAIFYMTAAIIRSLSADSLWQSRFIKNGWYLFREENRFTYETIAVVIGMLAGLFVPRVRRSAITRAFIHISCRRREAILLAALMPVGLRLSLLPILPAPVPKVADEFGYLLIADTFAAGRLVNPPHPLWQNFETLYVLQQPAQASIYPVASGVLMAIPKALGIDPWYAVVAGVGLMCGVICWMLQGWVAPPWALLCALLAGLHVGIDTYWMNSYWGGALAAAGGALVLGAFPRLLRRGGVAVALAMSAGLAILAQSRPFEGSLLFLSVAGALIWHYLRKGPSWRRQFLKSAAPTLAACGLLIMAITVYYNWRVTGNPLLPPYLLHQQVYGTPQNLRFGPEVTWAPRAAVHSDIKDNFEWQRELYHEQIPVSGLLDRLGRKLEYLWAFFLGPALSLPLLLFGLWDRRVRFLSLTAMFVVLGAGVLYPFFFPHYVAPVYSALLALAARGLVRIRSIRLSSRPVGHFWLRTVLASSLIGTAMGTVGWTAMVAAVPPETTPRVQFEQQLKRKGGSHLVLVRYSAGHDFHKSWIYNDAQVDESSIVWARDLGKEGNKAILRYYNDREVWLAEPDENPPLLTLYADLDRPRITSIVNAAGKSSYFQGGVAPGSLVIITGRNLARGVEQSKLADGLVFGSHSLYLRPSQLRAAQLPRPIRLPDVRVAFNGHPAPIFAASRDGDEERLVALVPRHLNGKNAELVIEAGDEYRSLSVPVLPANPGIFEVRSSAGQPSGAVAHSDGTPVTPERPARRGETVYMLVTGLGMDPVRGVVVGVNHRGASFRSLGRQNGLDVITFDVPDSVPSGARIPLSMAVDGAENRVYSNNSSLAVR